MKFSSPIQHMLQPWCGGCRSGSGPSVLTQHPAACKTSRALHHKSFLHTNPVIITTKNTTIHPLSILHQSLASQTSECCTLSWYSNSHQAMTSSMATTWHVTRSRPVPPEPLHSTHLLVLSSSLLSSSFSLRVRPSSPCAPSRRLRVVVSSSSAA